MGLDMYLNKHLFVWGKERDKLKITGVKGVKPKRVKYIIEEIGYWRKANAIHQWFVDNVQNGEDNCQEAYVSEEDLKKLLALVNKVLDSSKLVKGKVTNGYRIEKDEKTGKVKQIPILEDGEYIKDPSVAKKLLPTTSGFFFGGKNYDQWYINDLKLTKKIITQALKETDSEIYYRSSW